MAGMGPAPKDPNKRARRNATVAMTMLPAEGRKGRAPKWPLAGDVVIETQIFDAKRDVAVAKEELEWATTAKDRAAQRRRIARITKKLSELEARKKHAAAAEKLIWAELWKTPQATQWEKRGWFREVALYARHQAKAEAGSLDDSKEARQREDRLGLNDMAMLRLRWAIGDKTEPAGKPGRRTSSRGRAAGARARRGPLHAVPDLPADE